MDCFGVPKKINRLVLKALYSMKELGLPSPNSSDICDFVENSASGPLPLDNLPTLVRKSLRNMTELGVITKNTSKYSVRELALPSSSRKISHNIFRTKAFRTERSSLDPNMKRRHSESDDSMCGTDLNKVQKRFRSNNPIKRKGKSAVLPKVRRSHGEIGMRAQTNQACFFHDDFFTDDEGDWKSGSSMDGEREPEPYDNSDDESSENKTTQVTQTESLQSQEKTDPENAPVSSRTRSSGTKVVDDKSESNVSSGQSQKVVRTESQVKAKRSNESQVKTKRSDHENDLKKVPCPSKDTVVKEPNSYIA